MITGSTYVDDKTLTICFFNKSDEKLLQILLEYSQQIVESYAFVLAKLWWKRPFQSTQICNFSQNKDWTFWQYVLHLCTKCDRSIVCKNIDVPVAHCSCSSCRAFFVVHLRLTFVIEHFYKTLKTVKFTRLSVINIFKFPMYMKHSFL